MRVLYGIQSTGNGHLTRSAKIIKQLIKSGCMVDVLTSGHNPQVKFPFPIKWKLRGLTFFYDGNGGIDYWRTFRELNFRRFLKDIKLDLSEYDIIISDYEPITAWASYIQNKQSIGISNQCSFLSKKTPRPENKSVLGELLLKKLVPVTHPIGLHFESYDNFIYTPIIRDNLITIESKDLGYYTVYLPTYDLENIFRQVVNIKSTRFEIFTDIKKQIHFKNTVIKPIDKDKFDESLRNCHGVITSGGFQTSVEALYLGKKLMVVPTKGQYEQQCNAASLIKLGVKSGQITDVKDFVESNGVIRIYWKDSTSDIVEKVLSL